MTERKYEKTTWDYLGGLVRKSVESVSEITDSIVEIPKKTLVLKDRKQVAIPPEYKDAYASVEQALYLGLGIFNSESFGDLPESYGEMGGSVTAKNALELLAAEGKISDATIIKAFITNLGQTGVKVDLGGSRKEYEGKIAAELNAIRTRSPFREKFNETSELCLRK